MSFEQEDAIHLTIKRMYTQLVVLIRHYMTPQTFDMRKSQEKMLYMSFLLRDIDLQTWRSQFIQQQIDQYVEI